MGNEIDNFGIVRDNVLQFGEEGEFYKSERENPIPLGLG